MIEKRFKWKGNRKKESYYEYLVNFYILNYSFQIFVVIIKYINI